MARASRCGTSHRASQLQSCLKQCFSGCSLESMQPILLMALAGYTVRIAGAGNVGSKPKRASRVGVELLVKVNRVQVNSASANGG